ncbi:MAG: DUF1919 domain-containing protein [Xenococcaceae cyanobacterium]
MMLKDKLAKTNRYFLTDKHFTVISDDCWGAEVYRELGLPYATPFIGCFINPQDYLNLLENLRHYLSLPLNFIPSNKKLPGKNHVFPIALLGNIEINFMHYQTEEEVKQKWERRLKRINWNNLFFKIDFCRPSPYGAKTYSQEDITRWNQNKWQKSIAIVPKDKLAVFHGLYVRDYDPNAVITYHKCRRNFSLLNWLNNGKVENTKLNQILIS